MPYKWSRQKLPDNRGDEREKAPGNAHGVNTRSGCLSGAAAHGRRGGKRRRQPGATSSCRRAPSKQSSIETWGGPFADVFTGRGSPCVRARKVATSALSVPPQDTSRDHAGRPCRALLRGTHWSRRDQPGGSAWSAWPPAWLVCKRLCVCDCSFDFVSFRMSQVVHPGSKRVRPRL